MGKNLFAVLLSLIGVLLVTGCAYRYYLGMHGPSVQNYPDVHDVAIVDDAQCLGCHAPENRTAGIPVTSHPSFFGCLKCHNDPVAR